MVIVVELLHYILRQLVESPKPLSEDESFSNFKELLLRHAVYRPPHSMAILTFEDVKKINIYAMDTFYRHFDMYKYCMTSKEELNLTKWKMFDHQESEPQLQKLDEGKNIKFSEIPDL